MGWRFGASRIAPASRSPFTGRAVFILAAAEKSLFTRRRKEAYEALHGSAKENRAKVAAEARWSNDVDGDDDACGKVFQKHEARFDEDQAARTGETSRLVRLNAERGEKIAEDVLDMITGTHLDSGATFSCMKNW